VGSSNLLSKESKSSSKRMSFSFFSFSFEK